MSIIPKKIHYCWFGGNTKSELLVKCIKTWEKHFPNYEIIEWNEENYDVTKHAYMKEAYECGKWAFVSDYARLDVIYQHGGIYFDTDVEVLKNFEHLIQTNGYLCFENTTNKPDRKTVATGLGFAAPPNNKVIEALLKEYDGVHFLVGDTIDMTTCPVRNTSALVKLGLKRDGTMQQIEDIIIYPFEFFCGYDIINNRERITENTYTIHHYAASWRGKPSFYSKIRYRVLGPLLRKILGDDAYNRIKSRLKK